MTIIILAVQIASFIGISIIGIRQTRVQRPVEVRLGQKPIKVHYHTDDGKQHTKAFAHQASAEAEMDRLTRMGATGVRIEVKE